ncbi:hypothetical protein LQ318_06695 [Aliifodinibius salicampi]|uniref:Cytochrome c-552/4 domain-containing protein n=1 Tax=Fodinibius salicampi TaxID=1920655 RepID=A0ABT3PXK9_9BACT|nr:cytochrome b/b6 domain-containing protein [Fodinibius salicampi]MCW9712586.1 hypothetical protein [Fodinibius salicampi]
MTSKRNKWVRPLLYTVSGFLLFEILTGLSIYLLPFSVGNQLMVLLHTVVGLLFLFPYLWYQYQHWLEYKDRPINEFVIMGYVAMAATTVAIISGLILTYEALFMSAITAVWKKIHLTSTFVLIASVIPHVGLIIFRDSKAENKSETIQKRKLGQKKFSFNSAYLLLYQFAVVGLLMFAYSSSYSDTVKLPNDYPYHEGAESPFAPSLARTESGDLIDAERLGGSESCGTSGCHSEIKEEWETSAHRYAASDPFFRKIQENMGKQKGAVASRYCAGCHDPIGLFAGSANLYSDKLTNNIGLDEGISCVSCHTMTEADVQGNADYAIISPERYIFELKDGKIAKLISDFLIRAYPEKHVDSYSRTFYKTSEYCGSCHKQYIDEDINNVGWVQLQNQYDQWRKSHWNDEENAFATLECRDCHMPLTASEDPARGDALDINRTADDKKHRSHRFLGGNQYVPKLLDLPNADKHVELIEEWLRGDYEIPEIQDKWVKGETIPISIISPDSIQVGEELNMDVIITNKKAGHEFPTGPLDMMQSWIEIIAKDQDGNILFSSGTLDEDHFIESGSFIFKAEPVDQYGNLIDRHNLWELVGVRYSRALYPGKTDYARFAVDITEENITDIYITAKLQYRKFNQFLMNEVFTEVDDETAPITTVSSDTHQVKVSR